MLQFLFWNIQKGLLKGDLQRVKWKCGVLIKKVWAGYV